MLLLLLLVMTLLSRETITVQHCRSRLVEEKGKDLGRKKEKV